MAPRIQVYTDIACRAIDPSSGALETSVDCSSSSAAQSRAAAIQACMLILIDIRVKLINSRSDDDSHERPQRYDHWSLESAR